uniref:BY PROTMAP: gi/342320531/gb/EGU12471.1/ Wsc4p [Rhodotorula glutinis ATCC 204091] n=1 Tax=Rhodotorula toruloides TaxID=5286 RepID=A0A0K3CH84_RHOTO
MPSPASTSSPAPSPSPPPLDERIPLSSVPDSTKLFPPLIQDAIKAEMDLKEEGAYYDEFEQLYWMYSGWEEVLEDYNHDCEAFYKQRQEYSDKYGGRAESMSRDEFREAAAALDKLKQLLAELDARIKGPPGAHFKRFPILNPEQRLVALPSMRSRRTTAQQIVQLVKTSLLQQPDVSL